MVGERPWWISGRGIDDNGNILIDAKRPGFLLILVVETLVGLVTLNYSGMETAFLKIRLKHLPT